MIDNNYIELKNNFQHYFDLSKNIGGSFGAPSLYFHQRALEERERDFLSLKHLEMIYATLVSWGMHRMGDTKTKMVSFDIFTNAIYKQREKLIELKDTSIVDCNAQMISELKNVCFDLSVSISNSKIVGNSKTLAHILPNIVPPIDRQHTILFFSTRQPSLTLTIEKEYFIYILEKTKDFVQHIQNSIPRDSSFHTSYPKIFDNCVMTFMKTRNR